MHHFTAWFGSDWSSRLGSKTFTSGHRPGLHSMMPLRQLQTSISSSFSPLDRELGAKRGNFSWVTPPRPQGTSRCADLKFAALPWGFFVWNPAEVPTKTQSPQGIGGDYAKPLSFTAKMILEMLWEDFIQKEEKEAFTRAVSNRKVVWGVSLESLKLMHLGEEAEENHTWHRAN